MKHTLTLLIMTLLAAPAFAQVESAEPDDDGSTITIEPGSPLPGSPLIVPTDPIPAPDLPPDLPPNPPLDLPAPDASDLPDPDVSVPEAPIPDIDAPDYSRLSSTQERAARLDDMFTRLANAEEASDGALIAEEIWAVWMNSGSASVDLILRRAATAQGRRQTSLARRLYDHVTRLQPDHAEGWARSSRLALSEEDYARAAREAITALTLEPRHFYALWTLGNVLERLGRHEEALDAYREANTLYPSLENVAERVEALEVRLGGSVL